MDVWAFQWNGSAIHIFGISRQDACQFARACFPKCQYVGPTRPVTDIRLEHGVVGAVTDARKVRNCLRLAALLGESF